MGRVQRMIYKKNKTAGVSAMMMVAALNVTAAEVTKESDKIQDESSDIERIVITGSRIVRAEGSAPSPMIIIGSEKLELSGTLSIGDYIAQLPQLNPTSTTANSFDDNNSPPGGAFLNLRGMGSERTLVLVDGRRHIGGSAGDSRVDINTIPSALIERVEIVTGGASSVYGAGAVTGVVNFITKENFEGVSLDVRYGRVSENGFNETETNLTVGSNFEDDRGNAVLSFQWGNQSRLVGTSRNFSSQQTSMMVNPDNTGPNDGIPDNLLFNNAGHYIISRGGTILDDNLPPLIFNDDGSVRPVNFGTHQDDGICVDCDSLNLDETSELSPEFTNYSIFSKLSYDLTDNLSFFGEGKFVRTDSFIAEQPAFNFFDSLASIRRDNAYLQDDLADWMDMAGLDAVSVNRFNIDAGSRQYATERQTTRVVTGLKGYIDDNWDWEASYVYGRLSQANTTHNSRIESRFGASVDAVIDPQTGGIVCRSTLNGSEDPLLQGCIPTSIMGHGAINSSAANWFNTSETSNDVLEQHVVSAFVSGDLYDLKAGPIGFAGGIEWREESSSTVPGGASRLGITFDTTNGPATSTKGSYSVKEIFSEVTVPIFSDVQFAKQLGVDASVRYADYSTGSSTVSWSVGSIWQPVDDIRFRVTYSKAVRAPNIGELFAPVSPTFADLTDPCSESELVGLQASAQTLRRANCLATGVPVAFDSNNDNASLPGTGGGNPNLDPETAKTATAGVVFTPTFMKELIITLDWWDIKIKDTIASVSAQDILDRCVDAETINNIYCPLVTRRADGEITNFRQGMQNISAFDASGIDFSLLYSLNNLFGEDQLQLNVNGSHLLNKEIFPFQDEPNNPTRLDGVLGNPVWSLNFDTTYFVNKWAFNYSMRVVDSTLRIGYDRLEKSPEYMSPLHTGVTTYHNLQTRYQASDKIEFYVGVNNVFDELPPHGISGRSSGTGAYDNLGRFIYGGVNVNF